MLHFRVEIHLPVSQRLVSHQISQLDHCKVIQWPVSSTTTQGSIEKKQQRSGTGLTGNLGPTRVKADGVRTGLTGNLGPIRVKADGVRTGLTGNLGPARVKADGVRTGLTGNFGPARVKADSVSGQTMCLCHNFLVHSFFF